MEAMNLQNNVPLVPIIFFEDQNAQVFDITSVQDATEHCQNP